MKKPKAKPAGASATEGGAEGDVAGEKDEGDGDEVRTFSQFEIWHRLLLFFNLCRIEFKHGIAWCLFTSALTCSALLLKYEKAREYLAFTKMTFITIISQDVEASAMKDDEEEEEGANEEEEN